MIHMAKKLGDSIRLGISKNRPGNYCPGESEQMNSFKAAAPTPLVKGGLP
jgi:hypothetical protein